MACVYAVFACMKETGSRAFLCEAIMIIDHSSLDQKIISARRHARRQVHLALGLASLPNTMTVSWAAPPNASAADAVVQYRAVGKDAPPHAARGDTRALH